MASTDFSLIVRHPEEGLTRHDLGGGTKTLGRGPDNDIQVLVSEVSVLHAEFSTVGDALRIVDKGSTNGTVLNGEKVGPEGADITPMSKLVLGATIDGYLVPSAVLAATPMEELAATIDDNAAKPKTAPVAVAAPAPPAGAKPAVAVAVPGPPTPGAQTVRLDQVKPTSKPGPAVPKPPGAPAAPLKPPGAPAAPKPAAPGAPAPATPKIAAPTPGGPPAPATPRIAAPAPGGPPAPAAPKLPAPAAPGQAAPAPPAPGTAPPAPGAAPPAPGVKPAAPVPLKRPAIGGGNPPAAPNAPTIALPKTPPKPGGQ